MRPKETRVPEKKPIMWPLFRSRVPTLADLPKLRMVNLECQRPALPLTLNYSSELKKWWLSFGIFKSFKNSKGRKSQTVWHFYLNYLVEFLVDILDLLDSMLALACHVMVHQALVGAPSLAFSGLFTILEQTFPQ